MDVNFLLALICEAPLPDNYTIPPFLSRPTRSVLDNVIKTIPLEIETCPGTIDFVHPTKPGDKTVVAMRLVERLLSRFENYHLAFWSVHEAIENKLLVAFRRAEVVQESDTDSSESSFFRRRFTGLRRLVPKFNPDKEPVGADGTWPEADLEFAHLRRLYESFVITHSPSLKDGAHQDPDGPLEDDFSRFRWDGVVYDLSGNPAKIIRLLWQAEVTDGKPVKGSVLTHGMGETVVSKVMVCTVNGKREKLPIFSQIDQPQLGWYKLKTPDSSKK